jgi:hypothetical protein
MMMTQIPGGCVRKEKSTARARKINEPCNLTESALEEEEEEEEEE